MKSCLFVVLSLFIAMPIHAAESGPIEMRLWADVEDFEPLPGETKVEVRGSGDRVDRWTVGLRDPLMTVYLPDPAAPAEITVEVNGPSGAPPSTAAACLVFPGGGYGGLSRDKEGHWVAKWMAARGVVGVAVDYRCGEGYPHPAPLADAQHAMRLVRSRAAEWGVDPERIGVMGFSAGGHLAACTATMWRDELEGVEEPLAEVSARPDFAVLVYPFISLRHHVTHKGSRVNLLMGMDTGKDDELVSALSADERVDAQTPPSFLIQTVDDPATPVEGSQLYFEACRKHGVPVEMHAYEQGGHGYGMWRVEGKSLATWPLVLEGWLKARGVITR